LATPVAAQPSATPPPVSGKVGFVSQERIMRESAPAARAQQKLDGEFRPRDQELFRMQEQLKRMQDDAEKNGMTMTDTQRRTKQREFDELNREFQRKQREFREDLNQRRNEEMAQIYEQANRVIRQIAKQEKYDIIVQDAVYFSESIDIT